MTAQQTPQLPKSPTALAEELRRIEGETRTFARVTTT